MKPVWTREVFNLPEKNRAVQATILWKDTWESKGMNRLSGVDRRNVMVLRHMVNKRKLGRGVGGGWIDNEVDRESNNVDEDHHCLHIIVTYCINF